MARLEANQSRNLVYEINRANDFVIQGIGYICILFLATMTAVVILGVFFRYVLNFPLSWPEEMSRYLMIWIAFLAASIPLRKGEHVAMQVVIQALPVALRKIIKVLLDLMILVFLVVLTKEGLALAFFAAPQTSPALGFSMLWVYLAAPVGGILMILQMLCVLVEEIIGREVRT